MLMLPTLPWELSVWFQAARFTFGTPPKASYIWSPDMVRLGTSSTKPALEPPEFSKRRASLRDPVYSMRRTNRLAPLAEPGGGSLAEPGGERALAKRRAPPADMAAGRWRSCEVLA